jgi:tetratricopeptide (TPR) repeat protein
MLRALLLAYGLLVAVASPVAADPLADIRAGNQSFAEGKLEQAVADFSRAIEGGGLDPESLALAYNNRGVVFGELGDFDRAILDYQRALELKPGDPKTVRNLRIAHTRRGLAAARIGEVDRALADLSRAIELEPGHPTAYVRRAELRLERGDVQAAIDDLEAAVGIAPDNKEARTQLERVHAALGNRLRPKAPAETTASGAGPGISSTAPAAGVASSEGTAVEPTPRVVAVPSASVSDREMSSAASSEAGTFGSRLRITSDVFVRAEPTTASPAIGSLRRGAEFTSRGEEKGWLKVELADGRTGWVYRRFVEPVVGAAQ